MKKIILPLLIVASLNTIAKPKVDKDALIDSLTKANISITTQLDSASKELASYKGMYTVIRDRVIKHDFDPTKVSEMIDSIYALEKVSTASYTILKDSLAFYKNENAQLKMSVNGITQPETANGRLVYELKQLKDLLDNNILTQAEFDIRKEAILRRWQ